MIHLLHIENLKLLPVLPLLYFQAKKVRKNTPILPPALNPKGVTGSVKNELARILIIGESTMAGLGVVYHADGFSGALSESVSQLTEKKVIWEVHAKSGYTVQQLNDRIIKHIQGQFDLIVIGVGGNDAFTLNTTQQWSKDILKMIQLLRSKFPAAKIVFINMPPIHAFPGFTPLLQKTLGNRVELLGRRLKQLADRIQNVYYINEKIELNKWKQKHNKTYSTEAFFSDGIHPSKRTYQTWAKEVAAFIIDQNLLDR
ncbi:MAG: SGNH/GDSL hydrolase family protein [Saprospiraceae bacterium]|nr:SGNH/GDSL hydrolase family protein [Saprospiraceae bacterium]